MDKKRLKRIKPLDDGLWDCSVCTYKNSHEAFKCAMCDVRKGTSTRKPKPNPQLVAQQVAQQQLPPPTLPRKEKHPASSSSSSTSKRSSLERERGGGGDTTAGETDTSMDSVDTHSTPPGEHPSTAELKRKVSRRNTSTGSTPTEPPTPLPVLSMEVTVGDVTVVITDCKPPGATQGKRQQKQDKHSDRQRLSTDNHESSLSRGNSIDAGGSSAAITNGPSGSRAED